MKGWVGEDGMMLHCNGSGQFVMFYGYRSTRDKEASGILKKEKKG